MPADAPTPTRQDRLEELYGLIDDVKIAMLTSMEDDGSLVCRPMAVQERRDGVDLWFMTNVESHKVEALRGHPEVNVMFYKDGTREWVSASGAAILTQDKARIHELYEPDWKAWLGDEGGDRDGGPDDPRIMLIEVDVHMVNYFKAADSRPVQMFKFAAAMVTGTKPDLGEVRHLEGSDIH